MYAVYNFYVTFLFFSIDFYDFYRIMSRGEEYLSWLFWNIFLCLLLCWFNLFLALTNFRPMFSIIWCCAVVLDLRRIQFFWLGQQTGWLTSMWNTGCKQSRIWWNEWLKIGFLSIFSAYLSITFLFIYSRRCKITKNILNCNIYFN